MLQCYNRGCGQTYDPNENNEDSCRHHPGEPYFHDAYKGWTCCNKKSVDFTEFLNIKGCTLAKHSNEKPPETEKPQKPVEEYEEPVQEVRAPIRQALERPSFESPFTEVSPSVVPALKEAIDSLVPKKASKTAVKDGPIEIPIGTNCKNGGCNCKYSSPEAEESECRYHPGVPIFHEGMKYWTCCQKRTSDFDAFMNQAGCSYGNHKWIKEDDKTVVNCRYDWHQTASNVIVAIYAKLYHYAKSVVKVNPIRLKVCLVFPDQEDAEFNLDLELRGIIKVESTTVKMYPTKVEVTMPKAEAGLWTKLDFPRSNPAEQASKSNVQTKKIEDSDSDSDVDLEDIELSKGATLKNIS